MLGQQPLRTTGKSTGNEDLRGLRQKKKKKSPTRTPQNQPGNPVTAESQNHRERWPTRSNTADREGRLAQAFQRAMKLCPRLTQVPPEATNTGSRFYPIPPLPAGKGLTHPPTVVWKPTAPPPRPPVDSISPEPRAQLLARKETELWGTRPPTEGAPTSYLPKHQASLRQQMLSPSLRHPIQSDLSIS